MNDAKQDDYATYLLGRSWRARAYRSTVLYPRLRRHLSGRVLDVGCGIGDFLRSRLNTVGLDVNEALVAYCRASGQEAHHLATQRYPFSDGEFDGAVLDNVLEHIVDPAPTVAELARVVRAGGRVIVGVPGIRGYARDPDHKRPYTAAQVTEVFAPRFREQTVFGAPLFRSEWMSRHFSQYAVYVVMERV